MINKYCKKIKCLKLLLMINSVDMMMPALRFKEFKGVNSSYKKYDFNDIFLFSTGKNIKQREASPEFEIPCLRYGELYYMYNEVIYEIINKTNLDKSELRFSKGNEILLPSAGEDPLDIGSASALTIENVAIGRTINILRPAKDNIYSQIYVAYYINHKLKKKIATLAKGSSISNVYNSDLKKLEILLPTLPEQQKIANFLTTIDTKIQQLAKKKQLLEAYKKGVMQQLFSQEIRFKDEDGKEFEDWEEKRLGDLCKLITKGTTPTSLGFRYVDEGINFIKAENISNNFFIHIESTPKISSECNTSLVRSQLKNNDILFSIAGTLGRTAIVKAKDLPANTNQALAIVRLFSNEDHVFINYVLNSSRIKKRISQLLSVGAQPNLNLQQVGNFKIIYPTKMEQQKIANFLTTLDDKITQVGKQLAGVQAYKKGLLQQMFI